MNVACARCNMHMTSRGSAGADTHPPQEVLDFRASPNIHNDVESLFNP